MIFVINVNISLIGLIFSPSIFQMSSTVEWLGQENVEHLEDAKDKKFGSSLKLKTLHFIF